MGIKPGILHRNIGIPQILRHGGQRYHNPVFRSLVFSDEIPVAVIDKGGLGLSVQGCKIQLRCSLNISFGNTQHCTGSRDACQHCD